MILSDLTTGMRYQYARKRAGLSVGQVVKNFGVDREALENIEAGRLEPVEEDCVTLAAIYDVSVGWLWEGTPAGTEADFRGCVCGGKPGAARELIQAEMAVGSYEPREG